MGLCGVGKGVISPASVLGDSAEAGAGHGVGKMARIDPYSVQKEQVKPIGQQGNRRIH